MKIEHKLTLDNKDLDLVFEKCNDTRTGFEYESNINGIELFVDYNIKIDKIRILSTFLDIEEYVMFDLDYFNELLKKKYGTK